MPRITTQVAATILALSVVPLPSIADAQSLWASRSTPRSLLIEVLRPDFEGVDESVVSGALFVGFRAPLGKSGSVVLELPAARFAAEGGGVFTLGKAYVGLEQQLGGTPLFLEAGTRLNVLDINEPLASLTGVVSDVNRWEGFLEATSFQIGINARHVSAAGAMVRVRVAPVASASSGGFGGTTWDGYLLYSLQAGFEGRMVRIGAGIFARTVVFEDEGLLGERTTTQGDLHADFGSGILRPGIEVKAPLGDLGDAVPLILGVSLGIALD